MKIAIIGAAGFRTPLILQSIITRQDRLRMSELSLMDIDGERLELIGALTLPIEKSPHTKFTILRTTDPIIALQDADFVITTFRVGGIESRVIDERVPLNYGIIGQETTGPGGFAMGLRSIPVIIDYVKLMSQVCPNAWLINFANPAGMLTEAVIRQTGWSRVVGICDAPSSMHQVIAALLSAKPEYVYLDYFGLNHLGWIKRVIFRNRDYLPDLMNLIKESNSIPGLPFDPRLILNLGMIPNEYLYYYYYANESVNNILNSVESRGEQLAKLNLQLMNDLKKKFKKGDIAGIQADYQEYLIVRGNTYMVTETGKSHNFSNLQPVILDKLVNEGYAGVALDLIEALTNEIPKVQILNIANHGAIHELGDLDVVEIPALVNNAQIQPMHVGKLPDHCLGLIKQVKHYEHLTIEAVVEASYEKAVLALTFHPLIRDYPLARKILNEYISQHQEYFPKLH